MTIIVYDRYSISPFGDMNFGAMLINSKKSKTFMIENRNDKFDLKYVVSRVLREDKETRTNE